MDVTVPRSRAFLEEQMGDYRGKTTCIGKGPQFKMDGVISILRKTRIPPDRDH